MAHRLPPFKSIEAFLAAGQAVSFTKAASELHITVPAVSRRIQALEAELGVRLFERTHRMLKLTRPGRLYLSRLGPAFEAIRDASERARDERRRQSVKVSAMFSFGANWLVPRLPAFYALHKDIEINVESAFDSQGELDLDTRDIDVAIRAGTGNWPGVHAERLLEVESFPVCSADFLAKNQVGSLHDLTQVPLLGLSQAPWLWPDWLKAAGITESVQMAHTFDTFHTLYRAAVSGLGVALGFDILVKPYLEETQLIHVLDVNIKYPQAIYVIYRAADIKRPQVSVFLRWLFAEAAAAASEQSGADFAPPLRKHA